MLITLTLTLVLLAYESLLQLGLKGIMPVSGTVILLISALGCNYRY